MHAAARAERAPAGDATGLRVTDLTVRYHTGAAPVLRSVGFQLAAGERAMVVGPSGAGKSTLALCCAGLIPRAVPALVEGRVELAGEDLAVLDAPQVAVRIGVVLQDPDAQVVRETVFDEICFALENLCLPADEIVERVRVAMQQVGLAGFARDDPDRLSGGQRQRLAIACALAQDPRLIVLDEPTAQLDPAGRRDVYAALGDLAGRGRSGLLLVEHDPEPARELVDRVLALDGAGRLVLDEPPATAFGLHRSRLDALGVTLRPRLAHLRGSAAPAGVIASAQALTVERRATAWGRGGPRRIALDDVDLQVRRGSFTVVAGANGSGKTTLLRALAGTIRPTRGGVRVSEVDPRSVAPRRLREVVGFAFQNPSRQFVQDVVDADLAQALGVPTGDSQVEATLARFGLKDQRGDNPQSLSFGQQRRLSVAVALAPNPDLALLDEPCAGLDREAADALLADLTAYVEGGGTVVMATHDLQTVERWATRAAVLDDGRLLREGPLADVLGDEELLRRSGLRAGPDVPASGVTDAAAAMPAVSPAAGDGPLSRLNPLAKLAVALPVMLALFLTDNPAVMAAEGALGLIVALAGSRRARHELPRVLPIAVLLGFVMTAALAVWARPQTVTATPAVVAVGAWGLQAGAVAGAAVTVGRIAALLAVGTTFALTTGAVDLVRALMRQLHLPYRVGYTILASYRFVPRLLLELETIRDVHRLRALSPGRGPVSTLRRWAAYPFPLLVAAIRHAEQVATSMDARAFGAYPRRTERQVMDWLAADTLYVVLGLAAATAAGVAAVLLTR